MDAERVAEIAGALAAPVRVRILDVLRRCDAEVCQCELIALFDLSQSLLSHHIKKLVDTGLVRVDRRHRWAWYSLAPEAVEVVERWLK